MSLWLSFLLIVEIAFSVISLVRMYIILRHQRGCQKPLGKKCNNIYFYSQSIRLIALLALSYIIISHEAAVCLCRYRGWFYDNCYVKEFKGAESDNIFDYQCFPKVKEKNDWIVSVLGANNTDDYNFQYNTYSCISGDSDLLDVSK